MQEHGLTNIPELFDAKDISADARTVLASSRTSDSLIHRFWAIYLDNPLVSFGMPGDYNKNGLVEQQDLDLVLTNWGEPASTAIPGWRYDFPVGFVDQEELDAVLANWGSTRTAASAVAAIPEPSAAVLLAIGLGCIVANARRKRR